MRLAERRRLRAEGIARRAADRAARAAARAADQAESLPLPPAVEETPFVDIHGRPVRIDGLFRGAPLFIVLSGPSVCELDLSQLAQRGIVTAGVNNSPSIWRPNIWTYVDRANKFHDAIWRDPAVLKSVPKQHFEKRLRRKVGDHFEELRTPDGTPLKVRDMPGVIGHSRNASFDPDTWLHEPSINWGNSKKSAHRNGRPRNLNVMFAVLKTAFAMGFRIAFLLGCDFHMVDDRPYAFNQGKIFGGTTSNNNSYHAMNTMFGMLRPKFDAAGFQVFNCNPDSGLRVFDYLPFSEAIKYATAAVPQDPLDCANWYDI
jgi:hypothetical protein